MDIGLRQLTERRQAQRTCGAARHGIVQARVRPGHEASVVDICVHGALIETALRLLPGRQIELQLETASDRSAIRGRVLRCSVSRVCPSSVCYQGAIRFDQPLAWFAAAANHDEYAVLPEPHGDRQQS